MADNLARVGSALVYNICGLCLSKGATFVAQVIASCILGAELYGQASIVVNTTSVFATMAALGLGVLSTRFVAELRNSDKARLSKILGMTTSLGLLSSVLFGLTLFLVADPLAISQLGSVSMASYLQIASVTVAFSTYNGIQRGTLVGMECFRRVMIVDIVAGVLNITLGPVSAFCWGVGGYVASLAVVAIMTNMVYWVLVRREMHQAGLWLDLRGARTEIKLIWSFAIPTMLASILVGPVNWLCGVFVINSPGGYAEYGLYSAALQWRVMITTMLATFGNAMLPILVATKDSDPTIERLSMLAEWVVSIGVAAVLVPLSKTVAGIYGETYDIGDFSQCMTFLITSCVISSFYDGLNRKVIQRQRMWTGFLSNLIWAVAFVFFTLVFLRYGAPGIAFAMLASYGVQLIFVIVSFSARSLFDIKILLNAKTGLLWVFVFLWMLISIATESICLKIIASCILLGITTWSCGLVGAVRKCWVSLSNRRQK